MPPTNVATAPSESMVVFFHLQAFPGPSSSRASFGTGLEDAVPASFKGAGLVRKSSSGSSILPAASSIDADSTSLASTARTLAWV